MKSSEEKFDRSTIEQSVQKRALLPKLELADRAFRKCEKLMQGIVHFDTLTDSLPESLVYVPMGIRTCKGRPPYQISHIEWVRDVPWNLDGGVIGNYR